MPRSFAETLDGLPPDAYALAGSFESLCAKTLGTS